MTLSKRHERLALAALVVAAAATGILAVLAVRRDEGWLFGTAALAGVGAAVGLLTMMHAVLRRQAAEEARDADQVGDRGLFSEADGARIKARNLRQFERFFIPAATGLLALAEFTLGLFLLRLLSPEASAKAENARVLAAVVLVGAVLLYLLGSYLAGLAFGGKASVLRATAGELIGLAWVSSAGGVLVLLALAGLPNWSLAFGRAVTVLLMVRGIEKALTVVLEIYRPRRRDAEERLVYESRLNGLVAQPRSIAANLAETLNYQFGINLSRTGFRGVAVILVLTVLFHTLVLGLLSCFVIVNVGEQAVIERWGQPLPGVRGPGVHAKLPWPMERVYRHPVDRVHELVIGADTGGAAETALWTDAASAELEEFITASRKAADVETNNQQPAAAFSLVHVSTVIQYQVADLRHYLYGSAQPDRQLELIARRELVRLLSGRDLFAMLQEDRSQLNEELLERIQQAADRRKLGVRVQYAGIRRLQPPPEVVAAFQEVIAADQDRKRREIDARGRKEESLTAARSDRARTLADAESYRDRRVRLARAEAAGYRKLLNLYTRHKDVYRARAYLDRMEKLRDVRKVVLATDLENQVIKIDLKKSKSELFEFTEGIE